MTKLKYFVLITLLTTFSSFAYVEVKGIGTVEYERRLDPPEEQLALKKAKLNALRIYTGEWSEAKYQQYESIKGVIESDLDQYVDLVTILSEKTDKSSSTHTKVIRASINVRAIELEMSKRTASSNVDKQNKSEMAWVFVARRANEVTEFDIRRTDVTDVSGTEQEAVSEIYDANTVGAETTYSSTTIKKSGGSNTIKADAISWGLFSSQDMESTMERVFQSGGFEVILGDYIEDPSGGLFSVDAFKRDYSSGDDLSSRTKSDSARACKNLDITYLATGTMDVGSKKVDSQSGFITVYVTVNARIVDCSGRFPKTVASVGPEVYDGRGPDLQVAEKNAIKAASEKAALELVSQLANKNIY